MFSEAIKGLISFKERTRLSWEERARAKEYIQDLFKAGFSPREIEYIAGGKKSHWKENTIKKYCKGLEVKDVKTNILQLLEDFVIVDGDWDELEEYIRQKKALTAQNTSFEELLELKQGIEDKGVELEEMAYLIRHCHTKNIDLEDFVNIVLLIKEIGDLGYDFECLKLLQEKTVEFGGVKNVLFSILHTVTMKKSEREAQEYKKTIDDLYEEQKKNTRLLDEQEAKIKLIQGHYDFARILIDVYRIDPLSFKAIIETAKKYGSPMLILQALNEYEDFNELKVAIAVEIGSLQAVTNEVSEMKTQKMVLQREIDEFNIRLGAIKERTKLYKDLQDISNLITIPTRTKLTSMEFMLLAQSILLGIRTFAKINRVNLPGWSLYVENNLENTISMLNQIISESYEKAA